ncbi:MAG: hypothetical protein RLO11_12790 [Salinisphaeraceae bacterium]
MDETNRRKAATPQTRLCLPHRAQALGMLRLGISLAIAAIVAAFFDLPGIIVAAIVGTFSVILLMAAGIQWMLSRGWQDDLRRFEAGDYEVHWTYDDETWARFCGEIRRGNRRALWIAPLMLAGIGLVVAYLLHGDADLIFDSVFVTYVLPTAAGAGIGLLFALGIVWLGSVSERIMARMPGECFIGAQGLYITGQYWPWRSFGQRFTNLEFIEGEPGTLRFHYVVTAGNRRIHKELNVPVPHGEDQAARRIVDMAHQKR